MNSREIVRHIYLEGIKEVLPGKLISNLFSLRGSVLKIGYHSFDLNKVSNVYILGAGKASASMAHYVECILGNHIADGFVVTKYGHYCKLKSIRVMEAGHPVPDQNSFVASEEILKIADQVVENDLVICLWSGGGSSLLSDFPEGSNPSEMAFFNEVLVNCGADIDEINKIRKHLSKIKGGQLARNISPASCVSVFLSDVIGDHLETIASGPTFPDSSTFEEALSIIQGHQLGKDTPPVILKYITDGVNGLIPETPKPGDPLFINFVAVLAGNNKTALAGSCSAAERLGLSSVIITSELAGDVNDACNFVAETTRNYKNNKELIKPACLLFGGETTVRVSGDGHGGRNQHFALSATRWLKNISGITLLAAGTDGTDGNTEMAGAIVDSETYHVAQAMNVDPEKYLAEFDSYNFFKNTGGHLFTGPTMTNVMDMIVVIIE
jgi:glycerate 2-kinase